MDVDFFLEQKRLSGRLKTYLIACRILLWIRIQIYNKKNYRIHNTAGKILAS